MHVFVLFQENESSSDANEYDVPTRIPVAGPALSKPLVRVVLRNRATQSRRTAPVKRRWQNRQMPSQAVERVVWKTPNRYVEGLPQSPDGIFNLFFDDDVVDMIVSRGNHSFTTTPDEVRVFIAILLISGYNPVPRRRMNLSLAEHLCIDAIANAMTRDRFDTMVRYTHLSDNATLDEDD